METSRPITSFKPGSLVRIQGLEGCPKSRCRLCAMGLTPGTVVEIRSNGRGPCRLKVRGADLVLGRGMSSRILGVDAAAPSTRDPESPASPCRDCSAQEDTACGGTPSS